MSGLNHYIAVDPELYNPAFGSGFGRAPAQDKGSGGVLVNQRVLDPSVDGAANFAPLPTGQIYFPVIVGTTWISTHGFDCGNYSKLFVGPEVTELEAGQTCDYHLYWSPDGVAWFADTDDVEGTPAASAVPLSSNHRYKSFSTATLGVLPLHAMFTTVRARFCKIEARISGGATATVNFHIQLL